MFSVVIIYGSLKKKEKTLCRRRLRALGLTPNFDVTKLIVLCQNCWLAQLPLPRVHHTVKDLGGSEAQADKEALRLTGVTWAGFKQGEVFAGHFPVPFASFIYQLEGNRLLATMDVSDAVDFMVAKGIIDTDSLKVDDTAPLLTD